MPRAKTPRAPLRPREGIALRAWVPSMDSVDDPLPLDQPGFLYNLHSCQRRGCRDQHARASRPHPERDHDHWNPLPASLSQQ